MFGMAIVNFPWPHKLQGKLGMDEARPVDAPKGMAMTVAVGDGGDSG